MIEYLKIFDSLSYNIWKKKKIYLHFVHRTLIFCMKASFSNLCKLFSRIMARWRTRMSRVTHKTSSKLTPYRRLGRASIVPAKFNSWASAARTILLGQRPPRWISSGTRHAPATATTEWYRGEHRYQLSAVLTSLNREHIRFL